MKVEATQKGFYTRLQEPGDRFEIDPANFSKAWMRKVGEEKEDLPKKRGRPKVTDVESELAASGEVRASKR